MNSKTILDPCQMCLLSLSSLKKVVTQQITNQINDCNLSEVYQSAYKAFISAETALLKVKNDVLNAVGRRESCAPSFTRSTCSIRYHRSRYSLMQSLHDRLGLSGSSLQWVRTYRKCRSRCVHVDDCSSNSSSLVFGVP